MSRKDWYKDRILWRAKKKGLIGGEVYLWEDFVKNGQELSLDTVSYGLPIIIAIEDEHNFTIVTDEYVISKVAGELSIVNLDAIEKSLRVKNISSPPKNSDKLNAQMLEHPNTGSLIWTPRGAKTFLFMNLLHMFPLRISK